MKKIVTSFGHAPTQGVTLKAIENSANRNGKTSFGRKKVFNLHIE